MARYRKVAVGGTFDKFHCGHEALIHTAFDMGDEVLIGITSDNFANLKSHPVESYSVRSARIDRIARSFSKPYVIKEIFDANGTADVDDSLDAIVVSEETESSAININEVRCSNGLSLLDIIVIEWVLAEDGVPISSTRIRKGEIDDRGHVL